MSRLDAEYDPAERHDLDRLESYPLTPAADVRPRWVPVCCCGWTSTSESSRGLARQAHDAHRDEETP